MENIKLVNKPSFLNKYILNELINLIYENKKIKNINSISFYFSEKINDKLVYRLSISFNESSTFIDDVKIYSSNDVILKNVVFAENENYKAYLYW